MNIAIGINFLHQFQEATMKKQFLRTVEKYIIQSFKLRFTNARYLRYLIPFLMEDLFNLFIQ